MNFENNPLDGHADNVLEVKMRHLEIIYNPKTVDTILEFLKPPPSQADSVNALLEVAGDTLEGLAAQTRAGLEYALEEHKRLDLRVDVDAPVMIIPQRLDWDDLCVKSLWLMLLDFRRTAVPTLHSLSS